MDTAFGWAGAVQHEDVYLPRSVGVGQVMGCGRFDLDDAFIGACFGGQLQCDGAYDVGGGDAGGGARQVSSSFGAVDGGAAGVASDPMGFLSSGVDVFASVVDGAGAHDGLLDTALAFSRELACGGGDGDGGAVSNGAMFSGYSGTTGGNISSGESNNYSGGGGGHDAEVGSPTSTISPTTPSLPQTTSAHQALHPKRKPADGYPTIAAAPPAPPLPRPGAKRKAQPTTTSITFGQGAHDTTAGGYEPDMEAMAQVKEMIYRTAAMRPVSLDAEAPADSKPRRKNVRISSDPQTVAARLRRERVSDRLRVLQKLVPGGSKMDTASMLDEAASYLKFLKSQVQALETLGTNSTTTATINSSSTARLTAALLQQQPWIS